MLGVGVDFGTSNSTVAWFDGRQLRFVCIETNSPILPTAIHLSKEYEGTTGAAAIERYVQENTARLVHLVPEILGQAAGSIEDSSPENEMAELTMSRNVVFGPLIDHGLPGRLFLGLKRLLGNPAIKRIFVFNRPYRLVALLTPVLLRLHEAVAKELRAPVSQAHIGRPVNFEGSDVSRNSLAVSRLTEACAHAGFRTIEFYPEPIAATLSFLWQRQLTGNGTVLTVDFGGGTLDLSVVRYSGARFDVLSTAGADLGGDRIDQLIFRRLLFPLLGDGEIWSRRIDGHIVQMPFPFNEYEEGILNWAITHTLNQNKYKTRLTELVAVGDAASVKFQRLKDLINYNYSYSVFSAIKRAKAELSTRESTSIDIPELNLTVTFTRAQLDEILAPMMSRLTELVYHVVGRANLPMKGINLVVRTGGSSQIVAVRQLLEGLFPDKVTEHDPFTSVAGGLAIADYHGYRWG
ncbi:MAG: putative chaperone protein [Gammaproteobacteria bacterium]|nr:putative chaperone protein [Gammaproteobacteria bacterium]